MVAVQQFTEVDILDAITLLGTWVVASDQAIGTQQFNNTKKTQTRRERFVPGSTPSISLVILPRLTCGCRSARVRCGGVNRTSLCARVVETKSLDVFCFHHLCDYCSASPDHFLLVSAHPHPNTPSMMTNNDDHDKSNNDHDDNDHDDNKQRRPRR